jgi:hypothetical protein
MSEKPVGHSPEIHLPSPSAAPIIVAAGITLLLTGLLSTTLLVFGALLFGTGIILWAFAE